MSGAAKKKVLIIDELTQLAEEGRLINKSLWRERVDAIDEKDNSSLESIYAELCALPMDADFPYDEPTELEEIELKSDINSISDNGYSNIDIDYFYGAWLGRCIGCALGQPCEAWSSERITEWYKTAGKYPINSYFPTVSGDRRNGGLATDEKINSMPIDDDTRFTVLNYLLVKNKGLGFNSWDVGKHWLSKVPAHVIYTAELQSYLNFLNLDECFQWEDPKNFAEVLREKRVNSYQNPYREWIGAQIRADAFGYLAAGKPKLAAKMAYNDAYFSHVKNGIYGEMFFAALIASAFTEKDLEKCFNTALSVVPKKSRFYEEAIFAKNIAESEVAREELIKILVERAGKYHNVHTINNAAFCIAAIMRCKNDFSGAVTLAVECGMDTDCNGATVGSVMGALLGSEQIPNNWKLPLNDRFGVGVYPYDNYSIKQFADEIKELYDKLHS